MLDDYQNAPTPAARVLTRNDDGVADAGSRPAYTPANCGHESAQTAAGTPTPGNDHHHAVAGAAVAHHSSPRELSFHGPFLIIERVAQHPCRSVPVGYSPASGVQRSQAAKA